MDKHDNTAKRHLAMKQKLKALCLHLWLDRSTLGLMTTLLAWSVTAVAALLAARMLPGELSAQHIISLLAVAGLVGAGAVVLVRPILRFPSLEEAATVVERHHPSGDVLRSSLDFFNNWDYLSTCFSPAMMDMTIESARSIYQNIDFLRFRDRKRFFKISGTLLLILLMIKGVALIQTDFFSQPLSNLLSSWEKSEQIWTNRVAVGPGTVTRFRGDVMTVEAASLKLPPKTEVLLKYRPVHTKSKPYMTLDMDPVSRVRYTASLPPLEDDLEYFVKARSRRSNRFRIKVITKPEIAGVSLTYDYPAYTGLSSRTLTSRTRHVVGIKGTVVTFELSTNKPIKRSYFIFDDDGRRVFLKELSGTTFSGTLILEEQGTFIVVLEDQEGAKSSSLPYQLLPLTDKVPNVTVTIPGKDIRMPQDFGVQLEVRVEDDFGINHVVLVFNVKEGQERRQDLARLKTPNLTGTYRFNWDLSGEYLSPNDIILYRVEAADTDSVSGPKWGVSRTYSIHVPSIYDFYQDIEEEQQTQEMDLEEVFQEETNLLDRTNKLARELRDNEDVNWEDKKKLEEIKTKQENLSHKMEELKTMAEKTIDKMKDNPYIGLETLVKMQELNDLMDNVISDEMKKVMEELRSAAARLQFTPSQRDLEKAAASQENVLDNIQRMLDLLKKIKKEQALDAAIKKGEELLKQQEELARKTAKLEKDSSGKRTHQDMRNFKKLSFDQKTLAGEEEKWEKNLQQTKDMFTPEDHPVDQTLKDMLEELTQADVGGDMEQASDDLSNLSPQSAQSNQQQAMQSLQKTLQKLKQSKDTFSAQQKEDLTKLLDQAIRSGLELSTHQEKVIRNTLAWKNGSGYDIFTPTASPMGLDDLPSYQLEIREQTTAYIEELVDLSHSSFIIPPGLSVAANQAASLMQNSEDHLAKKRTHPAAQTGKKAMALLNRIILTLLKLKKDVEQAQSAMGLNKLFEQIKQMAEQQRKLLQQLQEAGDLSSLGPSQRKQLEQMALQQEFLRKAMEQLMQQSGEFSKISEMMGKLAQEMRAIEEGLRSGSTSRNMSGDAKPNRQGISQGKRGRKLCLPI